MSRKVKISKWAESAFQFDIELCRVKTTENIVVLGKLPDGRWTVFNYPELERILYL